MSQKMGLEGVDESTINPSITWGVLLEVFWTLPLVVVSGASVMGSDPSGYSTFCPARCLNRSASDRGLNVVVEVVVLGGSVRMLNRLSFVVAVVGGVTGSSWGAIQ